MPRHLVLLLLAAFTLAACGAAGPSGSTPTSVLPTPTTISILPPPASPTPESGPGTSARRPTLGEEFSLQGGMTAFVDVPEPSGATSALKLTFETVVNDSRCPTSVQCVQAGDAAITIVTQLDDRPPINLTLHTTPMGQHIGVAYDAFAIKLLDLEPRPVQPGDTYALSDYTAKLVVTPATSSTPAATPSPRPQADVRKQFNACSLVEPDRVVTLFGPISAGPSPDTTATGDGQTCSIAAERAMLTLRFYRGDADKAREVAAELQQTGEPLPDLAKDTLGLSAFGQDDRKAIMLKQTGDYILAIGITFGSQSRRDDREQARYNLDTLQSIAFVRYAAGVT